MSNISAAYDNQAFQRGDETVISIEKEKQGWTKGEKITYSWNNLNVYASVPQGCWKRRKEKNPGKKHILKNVNGIVRPGELLAIMGASGAGKTTLLNVLNFTSDPAISIEGGLYINGQRVTPSLLTSRSAYVQQDDLFIGTFTVKEQLMFQAHLKMGEKYTVEQRTARVNEVMMELSLTKCADTLIGVPGRLKGISGGETKRLAFACEVLTDPPLMFCDEPTSGLDSFMAQTIVEAMKGLAARGKTIISTIHQPSSEVFALFDRVLLMAEGRVAYLGSTEGALKFFAGMGNQCPESYNPADFFIGILAIRPEKEQECRKFVTECCDAYDTSSVGQDIVAAAKANGTTSSMANGGATSHSVEVKKGSKYKASWLSQFGAVLKRAGLENIREPGVLRSQLFQIIVTGVLVGLIYMNQELNDDGVNNINGAIFLMLSQNSFGFTFSVLQTFCVTLPIFLREHFSGMYRTDVYYIAKSVAEIPLSFILPCVFSGIAYYMIGLNPGADRYFTCLGLLVLIANVSTSFGFFLSAFANSLEMAIGVAMPVLIPLMIFGGFFMNADQIPPYFIWIKYISWFNYGNEALIINQWKGVGAIECKLNDTTLCYEDGADVIASLSFNEDNMGFDIGLLFALLIGYRLLGYLFLLSKTYRKKVKNH